jgi:hypothetical protein
MHTQSRGHGTDAAGSDARLPAKRIIIRGMPVPVSSAYAIECSCGAVARGDRSAVQQIVRCGRCGQELFVFPLPPIPIELVGGVTNAAAPSRLPPIPPQVRFWFSPVLAGLAALIVVAAVVGAILRSHRTPAVRGGDEPLTPARAALQFDTHEQIVRSALTEGSFRLALREVETARHLHGQFPGVLSAERREQFRQWQLQATLLTDLLGESLGEIFEHSLGLDDREWQAAFGERYVGKSFVLDTRVWRDAGGHLRVDYQLNGGGLPGEWDVEAFALFRHLPLAYPQRLVFGARLAEIARTGRDRWRARPEPDSGVLITDAAVAAGLSLPLDEELRTVLRRQAGWAADLRPGRPGDRQTSEGGW